MNNKEKYLNFIKEFNSIGISDIFKNLNLISSGFYTCRYTLENMQKVTNELRRKIKELYFEVPDNNFILNTKEDNISFIKDISAIEPIKILKNLNIDRGCFYTLRNREEKYVLVIEEIKKQIDEVYQKYNTI